MTKEEKDKEILKRLPEWMQILFELGEEAKKSKKKVK